MSRKDPGGLYYPIQWELFSFESGALTELALRSTGNTRSECKAALDEWWYSQVPTYPNHPKKVISKASLLITKPSLLR